MKRKIISLLFVTTMLFVTFNFSAFSQSGQKWSTGLNSIFSGEAFGTSNNQALLIKVNNALALQINPGGGILLNSLSNVGNGIVSFDNSGKLIPTAFPNDATKVFLGNGTWGNVPTPQNYWQFHDPDIFTMTPGNIGIGTDHPLFKLDIDGDVRISENLYVGGGIIITDKVNATSEVNTGKIYATQELKSAALKADSIIMDSTKAFYGESNFKGDVKLKFKLDVTGDVQVNGNINTPGNISSNSIYTSNLNVSGQTNFESLNVNDKIRTSRITSLVGDSLIHFGDSSIVMNTAYNLLYTTQGSNLYIQCGMNLAQNATIINATRGNVGIGTSFPERKLHISVIDTVSYSPTVAPIPSLLLDNFNNAQTNSQHSSIGFRAKGISGGNTAVGYITLMQPDRYQKAGNFTFTLRNATNNYNEIMRLQSDGTVGIGTLTPTSKLYIKSDNIKTGLIVETSFDSTSHGYGIIANVGTTGDNTIALAVKKDTINNFIVYGNGHVLARDVIVKMGHLGDFVFNDDYNLMTIYELENYIKQNHHLPKIPSAKEVKENGMNVGEFQNLVLQKTEEQALYIISLQKQIDELKKVIEELKK
ncbi:MAG: hypothetical protein HY951_18175 [Bacteroidia bacterium]|nr:hypothetical protein [Bacteroidia bacterium]